MAGDATPTSSASSTISVADEVTIVGEAPDDVETYEISTGGSHFAWTPAAPSASQQPEAFQWVQMWMQIPALSPAQSQQVAPSNPASQHVRSVHRSSHQWPLQGRSTTRKAKQALTSVETRTTLMFRNLPSSFTRTKLIETLDACGFFETANFVYLPVDFKSGAGLGYAFVNYKTSPDAISAMQGLHGFSGWVDATSHKVLDVCWSDPHQGIDTLIDRYRNSQVMHHSVNDEFKPSLWTSKVRVDFPSPTKKIRPRFHR